jgi:hypothetical protein
MEEEKELDAQATRGVYTLIHTRTPRLETHNVYIDRGV